MGACAECRSAKVKCDQILPCSRCRRLGKVCNLHVSKQGQRTSLDHASSQLQSQSQSKRKRTPKCQLCVHTPNNVSTSEDAAMSRELLHGQSIIKSDHFGLQYLVRSWISLAFRRRSFSLLSRAGNLAERCGISMDKILCETEMQRGMDFLYPILLTETFEQSVIGRESLEAEHIPSVVWKAIDCNPDEVSSSLERRWIWMREMHRGITRYYCSPAFERDVTTKVQMEETYKANRKSVVDLFLPNRFVHSRSLAHQISLYRTSGVALKPSRLSGVKLQTRYSVAPLEVDQVSCMYIRSLDHDFMCIEYVPHEIPIVAASSTGTLDDTALLPLDTENLDLLDIGELEVDEDLELFFDLLM